jgi:DNA-binding transcriptional ArsR family regulator
MVAKDNAARKRASEQGDRRAIARDADRLRPIDGTTDAQSTSDEGALGLDRLIHERMRLGIVSALAANESLTFNDLKLLLGTTDGNLSVHARKLEDAKYITCTKSFEGRVPRTEYKLTADGRRALKRYVDHMEALIRAIRER